MEPQIISAFLGIAAGGVIASVRIGMLLGELKKGQEDLQTGQKDCNEKVEKVMETIGEIREGKAAMKSTLQACQKELKNFRDNHSASRGILQDHDTRIAVLESKLGLREEPDGRG